MTILTLGNESVGALATAQVCAVQGAWTLNSVLCTSALCTVCWAGCGFLMQRKHALATACAPTQPASSSLLPHLLTQLLPLAKYFEIKFSQLRKGVQKKRGKVWSFAIPGGGSPRVVKKPYCFFSVSMQNHSRTPKTCFTLGLKLFGYMSSFKNYFERGPFMLANPGQIMTNNKGNLFVFEVGPSVKFVSAFNDAIFNKKKWG